jgi:hypothetical protein
MTCYRLSKGYKYTFAAAPLDRRPQLHPFSQIVFLNGSYEVVKLAMPTVELQGLSLESRFGQTNRIPYIHHLKLSLFKFQEVTNFTTSCTQE